ALRGPLPHNGHEATSLTRPANRTNPNRAMPLSGDLGACGETALNVAGSFAGGLAGKFLAKYGAPWKWNKAYKLIKRVTGLANDLIGGAQEMWKASKAYDKAKGAWAAAKSKLAKSDCHSFLPGTQVELANGKRKSIEDVALGDTVVTTDPKTGKKLTRKVVGTIVTEDDKKFVDLTVATPDGDSSLVATVTHPFWVANEHRFIDASDLKPGMLLQTPEGKTFPVKSLRFFTERQRTHDLTIDGVHAYYVLAGETPVLVHNSNNTCPAGVGNPDAPEPLGRGSTGDVTPRSLKEQIAMKQAASDPASGFVVPLKKGMTDPRWDGSDGWQKMSRNIDGIEIHYVYNPRTGQVDDYKFKR
ncbi:Hint domain-containing protein, partial [Streptomyces sp. NPDC051020]|uniref:Hint domain-containing protein n=1 Tax=Streptomyces sp. NPDC051020 TaxID=3155409 RepID=UPI0034250F26